MTQSQTNPAPAVASPMQQILICYVDFDVWSGSSILRQEDLPEGYRLFESRGIRQGAKNLVDPELLKPFRAVGTELESQLQRIGVRFCKGWAVPARKAKEVRTLIREAENRFADLKTDFLRNFQDHIEKWCQEEPELAAGIRLAAENLGDLQERFGFEARFFKLAAMEELTDAEDIEDARKCEEGIRSAVYADAAGRCAYLSSHFGMNRPFANVVLRRHLVNLGSKLDGMKFLSPGLAQAVKLTDSLLGCFDAADRATGEDFIRVASALRMLSTVSGLEAYLEGKTKPEDFVDDVKPGIDAAIAAWAAEQQAKGRPAALTKRVRRKKTAETLQSVSPEPEAPVLPLGEPAAEERIPETKSADAVKTDEAPEVSADAVSKAEGECLPHADCASAAALPEADVKAADAAETDAAYVVEAEAPLGMTAGERADFIIGLAEKLASSEAAVAVVNEAREEPVSDEKADAEKTEKTAKVRRTRRAKAEKPEPAVPEKEGDDPFADLGLFGLDAL